MSDLGLQYVSGILKPTAEQSNYIVQVSDDGLNLVYRPEIIPIDDPTRPLEINPVASSLDLAVPTSDPQTTQLTVAVATDTMVEFAYELTARDTPGTQLYDRRGVILVYNNSGTLTDHSGMLDTYTTLADITGAAADVVVSGTDVIVRTTGGTSTDTVWQLRLWRAVTPF